MTNNEILMEISKSLTMINIWCFGLFFMSTYKHLLNQIKKWRRF